SGSFKRRYILTLQYSSLAHRTRFSLLVSKRFFMSGRSFALRWHGHFAYLAGLLRSFPDQARLALGQTGVAWATAAGIVAILSCTVTFVVVAHSLRAAELNHRQRRVADYQALAKSARELLQPLLMIGLGAKPDREDAVLQ